jgi:hypothetical protein
LPVEPSSNVSGDPSNNSFTKLKFDMHYDLASVIPESSNFDYGFNAATLPTQYGSGENNILSLVDGVTKNDKEALTLLNIKFQEAQPRGSPENQDIARMISENSAGAFVDALRQWWKDSIKPVPATPEEERVSLQVLESLLWVSKEKQILETLNREQTKSLIETLLVTLISPVARERFPLQKKVVIQQLNDITLRTLTNCNRTFVLAILIDCLVHSSPFPPHKHMDLKKTKRFSDLNVKCLAKLMQSLPKTIAKIDMVEVIKACHRFFSGVPVKAWEEEKANTKPLRLSRQLIHRLVEYLGYDILNILNVVIGDAKDTPLEDYVLRTLVKHYGSSTPPSQMMKKEDGSYPRPMEDVGAKITLMFYAVVNQKSKAMEELHAYLRSLDNDIPPVTLLSLMKGESEIFTRTLKMRMAKFDEQYSSNVCGAHGLPVAERAQSFTSNRTSGLYPTEVLRQRLLAIRGGNPGNPPLTTDNSNRFGSTLRYGSLVNTVSTERSLEAKDSGAGSELQAIRERLKKLRSNQKAAPEPKSVKATPRGSSTTDNLASIKARLANMRANPGGMSAEPSNDSPPSKSISNESSFTMDSDLADFRRRFAKLKNT